MRRALTGKIKDTTIRILLIGFLAFTVLAADSAAEVNAFGPERYRGTRGFAVPFDIVVDVNGETFNVEIPNSHVRLHATISDEDELLDLQIDSRRGGRTPRWNSSSVAELREEIDGALVFVRFFPIRRALGATPRIFAQAKVDISGDWIMNRPLDHFDPFNVPISAASVTRLDDYMWEVSSVFGPRHIFETPFPLLSGVVQGRQFDISIRELGFRAWPEVVVWDGAVPEPGSRALLLLCVAVGGVGILRLRKRAAG
jgi:hypothetical protein